MKKPNQQTAEFTNDNVIGNGGHDNYTCWRWELVGSVSWAEPHDDDNQELVIAAEMKVTMVSKIKRAENRS